MVKTIEGNEYVAASSRDTSQQGSKDKLQQGSERWGFIIYTGYLDEA